MDADHPRRCTAKAKQTGERCKRAGVPGTEPPVCKIHGGGAPQVEAKAKRRLEDDTARRAVAVLGLDKELDVNPDPHVALLDEVARATRWVAGIEVVIAGLEREALVHGVTKTLHLPDGTRRVEVEAEINVWLRLYGENRDRLVRACDKAINAGVSERLVRLEEEKGRMMAEVFRKVIEDDELDLSEEQRLTMSVVAARHLRAIGGATAA